MKNTKTKEKNIYELELHEFTTVKIAFAEYTIVRVPGGWIYHNPRLDSGQMNSTFVPFNNEFQKTE